MKTTLGAIRAHSPCADGWEKLLRHLGKSQADDEPLLIETILESNGLDDALWCLRAVEGHDREFRLYAVWCARRTQHLLKDPRSIKAIDIAEKYARGRVTADELQAAEAARAAARAAGAAEAASAAAWEAAEAAEAASAAAWEAAEAAEAASAAAWETAEAARRWLATERCEQTDELLRVCREIAAGRDPYPERDGR